VTARTAFPAQATEVVVLGGGCYGCFHARQLLKAAERGRLQCGSLVVVDRNPGCRAQAELAGKVRVVTADWVAYLVDYVPQAPPDAQLVPAPFAPHVLAEWLAASLHRLRPDLRVRQEPLHGSYPVPYDVTVQDRRYLSEAAWRCPATCPEPEVCPATRGARTWDLGSTVQAHSEIPLVQFPCRHFVFGVGTVPVAELQEALRRVVDRPAGTRVNLLTASHCHGVGTCLVVEETRTGEEGTP